jgi:hypothetical protein
MTGLRALADSVFRLLYLFAPQKKLSSSLVLAVIAFRAELF